MVWIWMVIWKADNLSTYANPTTKNILFKYCIISSPGSSKFKHLFLNRYRPGDAVESWLNRMLCLDVTNVVPVKSGCPPKEDCDLYYINRDTLFCYHRASEAFLQRIVSLFVASHYKNTPNDLQMMSDAPAHHLFCLLGPTSADSSSLPEVLCVIQVK